MIEPTNGDCLTHPELPIYAPSKNRKVKKIIKKRFSNIVSKQKNRKE